MTHYVARWEIDVYADSPADAVWHALDIQRNPESIATIFEVIDSDARESWDDALTVEINEEAGTVTVEKRG